MRPLDVIIIAALGIWLAFAIWRIVRSRGKCSGNCAGCSKCVDKTEDS